MPITYNFYTVPDEMTVYDRRTNQFHPPAESAARHRVHQQSSLPGGGAQNTAPVTINVNYPAGTTAITIIMNQFGNPYSAGGDAWIYTRRRADDQL